MENPNIIIADEPTPGLDIVSAKKTMDYFKNFKLIKIVNYFPAGNDVLECLCDFNGKIAQVKLGDEWKFINTDGRILSTPTLDYHNNNIFHLVYL